MTFFDIMLTINISMEWHDTEENYIRQGVPELTGSIAPSAQNLCLSP